MLDWNDLRYFLAVAQTGSTLAAGRRLNVSQTTAARRVAALEEALGLSLFERRQAGYALTPAGEDLLAQAEAVESAASSFVEAAASQSREATGTVRLTMVEIYGTTLLPPLLKELHDLHPALRIELDMTEQARDLAGGEADVALRGGSPPTGGGLVGRRIGPDPWTIYCSRSYAAGRKRPHTREELRDHPIIGGGGPKIWPVYRMWLERLGLNQSVAMEYGSSSGLLAAIRSGLGMAVLPSFMADRDPDLVRVLNPTENDKSELWLLTHERLRHAPRVRAVMDFLGDRLQHIARTGPDDPGESAWLTDR